MEGQTIKMRMKKRRAMAGAQQRRITMRRLRVGDTAPRIANPRKMASCTLT